jgi:uncharacterized protein YjbI with pentapeptide repeats
MKQPKSPKFLYSLLIRLWHWTGFSEKKLWDILQLLIIPIFLSIIVFQFQESSKQKDYQIAEDRAKQETLNKYFDQISSLLFEHKLRKTEENDEARIMARSRTLTALRELDGKRKGQLIKFLNESGLIQERYWSEDKHDLKVKVKKPIIDLEGSDLGGVELSGVSFFGTSFRGVNFRNANLKDTKFTFANLAKSNLNGANLNKSYVMATNFSETDLRHANLSEAIFIVINFSRAKLGSADFSRASFHSIDFTRANLWFTNLNGATFADDKSELVLKNLTEVQLTEKLRPAFLCRTIMPNGKMQGDCFILSEPR